MRKSRQVAVQGLAYPFLAPGEQVEIMTVASIGKSPVAKNVGAVVTSAAVSAATSVLFGGAGAMVYTKKPVYVVLTDRQVILFGVDRQTGRPTKYLASVLRAEATAKPVKDGRLFLKIQLDVAAPKKASLTRTRIPSLLMTFAPIPPSLRVAGRQFAAALGPDVEKDSHGAVSAAGVRRGRGGGAKVGG